MTTSTVPPQPGDDPAPLERATHRARPVPRDAETPFELGELFYSTTDAKGRIRSGNDVFARTSGYTLAELVGEPHNIVRHPDVPRSVFRALWAALEAGEPLAAYVKNLSRDGAFYWVLAYAAPADDGFLSIRIKPTSTMFDLARSVYAEMVALEHRHEDGTRVGREAGMAASASLLHRRLEEHGYSDYDRFIHSALVHEAGAREDSLAAGDRGPAAHVVDPALRALDDGFREVRSCLASVVGDARQHTELQRVLESRSRSILQLAERIRVHAINASLAASRLGDRGAALRAIASMMEEYSDALRPLVRGLDVEFTRAVGELQELAHLAIAGQLQAEMASVLVQERDLHAAQVTTSGDDDSGQDLHLLVRCLVDGGERLSVTLARLSARLRRIVTAIARLERDLGRLRSLEVSGRVEQARLADAGDGADLFRTVDAQVRAAADEIRAVREASDHLATYDTAAERTLHEVLSALAPRIAALQPARGVPVSGSA